MDICHHCQKPIEAGQARYTAGEYSNPPRFAHWDCHATARADLDRRLASLKDKLSTARGGIAQLRRRL